MKLTKKKLQIALDKLTQANADATKWGNVIAEHCLDVYGVEPGEIDCDAFIDRCGGGCGAASGMSVEEFEEAMEMAIKRQTAK